MDADLIIRGATVVTCAGRVLPDGEVAVAGGRIVHVGPAGSLPVEAGRRAGCTVIDGCGKALLPGLVNAHCHAAMTLFRGYADDMLLMPWLEERIFPIEARLTGEDVYWGTMLAAVEMLLAGVTCFADMYFFMDDTARACADSGIRASLSVGLVALGPARESLEKLDRAVDFARRWHGGENGRITTMLGPHAPYTCPPEFLREVIAASAAQDIPIHIHLAETAGEVAQTKERYGRTPVQLMEELGLFDRQVLAAHCVHVDAADRAILARMRGGVSHNPRSNLKLACGIAPVAGMLAEQVPVGLGTDGAASANQLGIFEEMRLAALLQKTTSGDPTVLPAPQALELATLGGARALGLARSIGSIEVGKAADLILVDLERPRLTPHHDVTSLLVYSAQDGDVDTVIVDGRVVVRNGRVLTVDVERVRAEVRERAARLAAEVGG